MAKVRVFELARELDIPGKELIKRIRGMGFQVKGNFDGLEEDQVHKIKSAMLAPVTRVEDASAVPEADLSKAEERPRKRRIISARRSKEVHKIQESLGISGPLPEDAETRSEVKAPTLRKRRKTEEAPEEPVAATSEPVAVDEPAAVPPPSTADDAGTSTEAPATVAAETIAVAPDASAAADTDREAEAPTVSAKSAEPPEAGTGTEKPATLEQASTVPKPSDAQTNRIEARPDYGKEPVWREADLPLPSPAPPQPPLPERAAEWRDVKRPDRRPAAQQDRENWLRRPRRRTQNKRSRGPRVPSVVRTAGAEQEATPQRKRKIRLGQYVTVSEFSGATGIKANEIIKKLMNLGIMATINQPIEGSVAELLAADFQIELEADTRKLEDLVKAEVANPDDLRPRPPIVTVMGHVDHGKTSLLDRIRQSDVTASEAGGITQHIGAYFVHLAVGDIIFLDTPGHEAFTSLRARGADITDLVVLVVAADDGVMPQTVEAIEHARAADVPIMVAVNKMDRPNADPDQVKRQLMEHQLLPEELGGDTVFVPVSAHTGDGIEHLLEMIHLQAELLELQAAPTGMARGYVIESKMDRRRGPVATVIVQSGTLQVGDEFVVGTTHGRVRAMFDDRAKPVDVAPPSTPVEILGYNELPQAGDLFVVMDDEKVIRQIAESRVEQAREAESLARRRTHLEDFLQGVSEGEHVTLNIVLKADAQGSLEAIRGSLEKIGNDQVSVHLVRAGVGGITETDLSLASTTDSIVIGFNVRADSKAQGIALAEGIDVKLYTIIYELIDDVKAGLQGLLKPIERERVIGHLEVRGVFSTPKDGQIVGGYVTDGNLKRNSFVRLFRDNVLVTTGQIGSLRRFKDDVAEVQTGYECGLRLTQVTTNVREGDLIEAFVTFEEAQTLESVAAQIQAQAHA